MTNLTTMSLNDIGHFIQKTWKKPYFGVVPYITAMTQIDSDGMYEADNWTSIVVYFLSNATTWHGEDARAVKKELNYRLKRKDRHPHGNS